MDEKYYIPEVEDLRVGFVYQYSLYGEDGTWEWKCLDKEDFTKITAYQEDCEVLSVAWLIGKTHKNHPGNAGRIRVPYLTKEQIEKEGWLVDADNEVYTDFKYKGKPELSLRFWKDVEDWFKNVTFFCVQPELSYEGPCKSINEFRTIMKLLNIK